MRSMPVPTSIGPRTRWPNSARTLTGLTLAARSTSGKRSTRRSSSTTWSGGNTINGNTLQQTVPLTDWYTGNFGSQCSSTRPIQLWWTPSILFANCPGGTAPAGITQGSAFPGNQIPTCMIRSQCDGSSGGRWRFRQACFPAANTGNQFIGGNNVSHAPAGGDYPRRSQLQQQVLGVRTLRRRID